MKKLTKKERQNFYLMAANRCLEVPQYKLFLCGILADLAGIEVPYNNGNDYTLVLRTFHEFALFEPDGDHVIWFGRITNSDDLWSRVDCMLLCAEMCKP